tara:strand:+ start:182 stop:415 length:234 start_codon:yes stop_codon:yes gene_type:complete
MSIIDELKLRRKREVETLIWENLKEKHTEFFLKLEEAAIETWELYNEEAAEEIAADDELFNRVCELSDMDRLNGPLG